MISSVRDHSTAQQSCCRACTVAREGIAAYAPNLGAGQPHNKARPTREMNCWRPSTQLFAPPPPPPHTHPDPLFILFLPSYSDIQTFLHMHTVDRRRGSNMQLLLPTPLTYQPMGGRVREYKSHFIAKALSGVWLTQSPPYFRHRSGSHAKRGAPSVRTTFSVLTTFPICVRYFHEKPPHDSRKCG